MHGLPGAKGMEKGDTGKRQQERFRMKLKSLMLMTGAAVAAAPMAFAQEMSDSMTLVS